MPQSTQTQVEIRIRDRVGVVNEVTGTFSALGLDISEHNARVIRDRGGNYISVFRAGFSADEAQLHKLRQKIGRIKGFLSFDINP